MWNGTPGSIHPQINHNIKRAKSNQRRNTMEASIYMEHQHPGLMTQMLQHHRPSPKSCRKTIRRTSSPRKHTLKTPELHIESNTGKDTTKNNTDKEIEEDKDNEDNEDIDSSAPNLPLPPGLLTKLFQDHSPPTTTSRKTIVQSIPKTIDSGLITSIFEQHPKRQKSHKKNSKLRNAQSPRDDPKQRRPHSARRMYHKKSMSPRIQHCLPGEPSPNADQLGTWSPHVKRICRSGRRSGLTISRRSYTNACKLNLTQTESPSPNFLQTSIGNLLQSPRYKSMPFEREWQTKLEETNLRMGSSPAAGKYFKRRERASRNGSTVVDFFITPPSFKLISLSLSRFPLSNTQTSIF